MISQIERHVKHSEFDQALALLPMLHQVFADHTELSHVITQLQQDLLAHNQDSLKTLQHLKHVIVG
ncbi:MAG: hypothetical protein HWE18_14250 [Gammaproteobacteria bacterium]|nr:hypothetical protein [Gammaproteobacteria bacterium]